MRRTRTRGRHFVALLVVVCLGLSACAGGFPGAQGRSDQHFSLVAMVHTGPKSPQGHDVPVQTIPWDGTEGGPFTYSSILCTQRAPVNDIATNLASFNSRLPDSRSPSSVRIQPLHFRASTSAEGRGQLEGLMTVVVCGLAPGESLKLDPSLPDLQRDRIDVEWSADFQRMSPEEIEWHGTFTITGGSGPYEGLTGKGELAGYFFCLGPKGCAEFNDYRDGQFVMTGTYQTERLPTS